MASIPRQKPPLGRRRSARGLAPHRASGGDLPQQGLVSAGVRAVDPSGQHGDRRSPGGQSGAMARAVDPVRGSRHDGGSRSGKIPREVGGDPLAVRCRRTRSDEGDRRGGGRLVSAATPERERGMVIEVVEPRRPCGIAGDDEPRLRTSGRCESRLDRRGLQTRHPPRACRGQLGRLVTRRDAQRLPRAIGADERARHPVSGFDQHVPHDAGVDVARVGGVTGPHRRQVRGGARRGIEGGHVRDPCRRKSARPTSSARRSSCPARSATVHATRTRRS